MPSTMSAAGPSEEFQMKRIPCKLYLSNPITLPMVKLPTDDVGVINTENRYYYSLLISDYRKKFL